MPRPGSSRSSRRRSSSPRPTSSPARRSSPRPGSRYREVPDPEGFRPTRRLSPRPRLESRTGNSRHDVRRSRADRELAGIRERIAAATERRIRELYEEELNCPGGYSDDRLFNEWRAETRWHKRQHGQSPPTSPRLCTPRRSRWEYEGVGTAGAGAESESDDDDIHAVLEAARIRREASLPPNLCRGALPPPRRARSPPRNAAWVAFAASAAPITIGAVPWPPSPVTFDALGVADAAPHDARKRAVREAVLCWHPDKWAQQFGDRLDAGGQRANVVARVTAVARDVHDLWTRLKAEKTRRARGGSR